MHSTSEKSQFIELRDEAFSASQHAHARMAQELAIFHNVAAYREGELLGGIHKPITEQSLNPEIQKGIHRLVPAFIEGAARIEMLPDQSREIVADKENIEDIKQWSMMMEEADNEGERFRTAVYHNLVYGHAISKAVYDPQWQIVRMISIDPCSFAIDPACTTVNLHNADYVVHSNIHRERYIRQHYPEYQIPKHRHVDISTLADEQNFRIDEIWLRRWLAKYLGVHVDESKSEIFKVTLIDDKLVRIRETPYWYPDIPFVTWRNFPHMKANGQGQSFWGHGYGALAWSQQKFIDEIYSNLIIAMRNMGVGGYISKKGAINMQNIFSGYGMNIEVDFQKAGVSSLDEAIKPFPPPVIHQVLYNLFERSLQSISEMMPSLNPVFTGQAPFAGASGRAVNILQWATFNQISANVRAMNEFRLTRKRMQISLIQQFARKPLAPHLWRRGIDFPQTFRDEARYVGYHLKMPDETSLPNTPTGKLQLIQVLAALGLQMPIDELIKFAGFDSGYGWDEDTFQQPVAPGQMPTMNEDITTGVDAGPI